MNRTSLLIVVAILALLVGACASSGQPAAQVDSSHDVAEMKERILELQEQAAVTEVEVDRLRAQLAKLELIMSGGAAIRTLEPSDDTVQMTTPVQEAPPVSAPAQSAIEESDLEPTPAIGGAIGASPGDMGTSSAVESTSAGSTGKAVATAIQPVPVEPAAQALYDRGYTLFHQGKYLDAEASFQRFLQAYPNTELSDNAQFWIGESRFSRGDTRGALAAFREVIQKFPDGNKVPDALIKEGDCLEKLGDRDGARDRYTEVKRRFPDSGAAVMAEDRLASLDG